MIARTADPPGPAPEAGDDADRPTTLTLAPGAASISWRPVDARAATCTAPSKPPSRPTAPRRWIGPGHASHKRSCPPKPLRFGDVRALREHVAGTIRSGDSGDGYATRRCRSPGVRSDAIRRSVMSGPPAPPAGRQARCRTVQISRCGSCFGKGEAGLPFLSVLKNARCGQQRDF